jgi:hypothetical protein
MKIYILGSNIFMSEMVKITDYLIKIGYDARLHPDYRLLVSGELNQEGEGHEIKIKNDYLTQNYLNILECDAVLLVNNEKNGIKNYVGGNGLMELGQAYVNNKKIFLLNNLPNKEVKYLDEIISVKPICLDGELENIKNY